ncbi:cytochrome P450 [Nocardioides sp.]|uniref:cytochrome P450 n=1 Tax=Nocardioides sp. TaxID=35761 RepID=UPI0026122A6B|nr:cytochrome P450 [Nocardioides sp.]
MADKRELREGEIDLSDRRHYASGAPHELFARLRAAGPVHRHWHRAPSGRETPYWSVVGHEEIVQVSRDPTTFSTTDGPGLLADPAFREMRLLVALDPPDHQRLRRLISNGFTPRMIARLEEGIAARAERILDELDQRAGDVDFVPGHEVDFVSRIAFPLPMHVIADIVGIPEDDRAWVFGRTDLLLQAADPANQISEADYGTLMVEIYEYAQRLSEHKRREPADDIWSLLAQAGADGPDGDVARLSGAELDAFFMILAIAGSETTRNALSQGLLELIRHEDQVAALRADPGLLPTAAEEVLRWSSPALMFGRTATRDVELGGRQIAAGDRVVLWYPAGNRDERVYDRPDEFDITRSPNPHLSFGGGGAHFCLGANLARTEIQAMLGALLRRFDVEVVGPPVWSGAGPVHNVGVSVEQLPVRLHRRR